MTVRSGKGFRREVTLGDLVEVILFIPTTAGQCPSTTRVGIFLGTVPMPGPTPEKKGRPNPASDRLWLIDCDDGRVLDAAWNHVMSGRILSRVDEAVG